MIKAILVLLCIVVIALIGVYVYIDDKAKEIRFDVKKAAAASSRWRVPTYTKYSEYVGRTPAFAMCMDEDHDMKIVSPDPMVLMANKLAKTRKTLKITRIWYEHGPEMIGKSELYSLVNDLAEQVNFLESALQTSRKSNERTNNMYASTVRELNKTKQEVERLKTFETFANRISSLPNCNDCSGQYHCPTMPKWGEDVRFNCPLHISSTTLRRIQFKKEN